MQKRLMLILGGARSGKSAASLRLAESRFTTPCIIATAEALDGEMAERIRRHKAERSARWSCIEEPVDLAAALYRLPKTTDGIVLDCLTVWASNVLIREGAAAVETRLAEFLDAYKLDPRPMICVSNEVGLGIVPPTPLGREFRDVAGRMNQRVAAIASDVVFKVSGLEWVLKGSPELWKAQS